jgi:hypothetical protein
MHYETLLGPNSPSARDTSEDARARTPIRAQTVLNEKTSGRALPKVFGGYS